MSLRGADTKATKQSPSGIRKLELVRDEIASLNDELARNDILMDVQ